jgi:hypothetical protein
VQGFELEDYSKLVYRACDLLGTLITNRTESVVEPAIAARDDYKNMLSLGMYRNKIAHFFFLEGLFAVVFYALAHKGDSSQQSSDEHAAVAIADLIPGVRFLFRLLQKEFIYKENIDEPEHFEAVLDRMVMRDILGMCVCACVCVMCVCAVIAVCAFMQSHPHPSLYYTALTGHCQNNRECVEVTHNGEKPFGFLCAMMWPFIDSYYVSALVLFSLQVRARVVCVSVCVGDYQYYESVM